MSEKTYILRFDLLNQNGGAQFEEQEHTVLSDAWAAFRLFAEPASSEMYTCIQLIERDWSSGREQRVAALEFTAPTGSEIEP